MSQYRSSSSWNVQQEMDTIKCILYFLNIRKCIHRYFVMYKSQKEDFHTRYGLSCSTYDFKSIRYVQSIRLDTSIHENKNWACTHIFLNNPSRKIIERIHYWFSCTANWSFYETQSWWNEIYQKEHEFLTSKLHLKCLWYFCTYWKVEYTR